MPLTAAPVAVSLIMMHVNKYSTAAACSEVPPACTFEFILKYKNIDAGAVVYVHCTSAGIDKIYCILLMHMTKCCRDTASAVAVSWVGRRHRRRRAVTNRIRIHESKLKHSLQSNGGRRYSINVH